MPNKFDNPYTRGPSKILNCIKLKIKINKKTTHNRRLSKPASKWRYAKNECIMRSSYLHFFWNDILGKVFIWVIGSVLVSVDFAFPIFSLNINVFFRLLNTTRLKQVCVNFKQKIVCLRVICCDYWPTTKRFFTLLHGMHFVNLFQCTTN